LNGATFDVCNVNIRITNNVDDVNLRAEMSRVRTTKPKQRSRRPGRVLLRMSALLYLAKPKIANESPIDLIPMCALFFCCCPLAQAQSCVAAPSGLVSWWTGDSNENDIIGGNNPLAVNAVTLVPAEVKDGFTFGTQGYIEIPPASDLANQQFTWTAWVMPAGPGPNNDSFGSVIFERQSRHRGVVARH
jgi:hypothetical protein